MGKLDLLQLNQQEQSKIKAVDLQTDIKWESYPFLHKITLRT